MRKYWIGWMKTLADDDDDDYSRGGGSDDAWNDGMRICEKALASKRLLLLLLLPSLDGEK